RPMVFPTNKTLTAVYGQPLTLSMEFCANPTYLKVFWIVKDKVYSPGDADSNIVAYSITNASSPNCHQAVLYMNRVTNEDVGEYTLIVRSANGLTEGVFNVNMTYASGYNIQPATSSNATPNARTVLANCDVNLLIFVTILLIIKVTCYRY
ncbi:Immunoglobulin, partial [Oryctes borbonicus]